MKNLNISLYQMKELAKNTLKNTKYKLTGTKTGYPSIDKTHEKGESFLKKHPIIPSISIYDAISITSRPYRNATALNCKDLKITYQELLDDVDVLSQSLKEQGITDGDIVTIATPNISQAVIAFLAANKIGAVGTFLNSQSSTEEIKHYLNLFKSPIVINYDKDIEYNKTLKEGTSVRKVITLPSKDLNSKGFNKPQKDQMFTDYLNYRDMNTIKSLKKSLNLPKISGNKDAVILFTSGSTGNPKSVVLTNKNIISTGTYLKNSSSVKSEVGEKTLVCVPFCYPYGFVTSTLMSLLCGREAILADDIGPKTIDYYMKKEPNMIFGSPALLEMIKKNTGEDTDMSSVSEFISGGDFLELSKNREGREFFKEHNADVIIENGSGNAETCGSGTNPVGVEDRPETVGKVLTGTKAIIIDSETGEELKYNEEGELCISGKNVFKEYYNEPELTKNSKFDYKGRTYFKTGSRGKLDEDGFFTLTGRASRFYITSSLNKVYCEHVQQVISEIPAVDSCAVVPQPDQDLLYGNRAYIVLKDGILPTEEEKISILERLSQPFIDSTTGVPIQLKEYEIPQDIEFIEELPRHSRSEKIDYTALEERAKKAVKNKVLEKR